MKKLLKPVWSIILVMVLLLASLPKKYIEGAIRANLFGVPQRLSAGMAAEMIPQEAYGIALTWAGHDVGYITNGTYSGISMDTVDLSSHDSADNFKEYGAGMLEGGELNIDVRFIPGDTTGQKYLRADALARTARTVVLTFPDATTFTFTGLCIKFGDFSLGKDDALDAAITIKVSGKPTFSED